MTQQEVESLVQRHSDLLSFLKARVENLTDQLDALTERVSTHSHGYVSPPRYGG